MYGCHVVSTLIKTKPKQKPNQAQTKPKTVVQAGGRSPHNHPGTWGTGAPGEQSALEFTISTAHSELPPPPTCKQKGKQGKRGITSVSATTNNDYCYQYKSSLLSSCA